MALDNFRKINITLNKVNQHILEPQIAKVGDVNGRELVVQLIDGGVIRDQTGVTLKLNWQHANGNQGSETFGALDASRGVFSVYYPEKMLYRGTVTANISINENGKITNSLNFQIAVKGDVFDGSAVEVNGVLITLKDLKNQLDERNVDIDTLENRQDLVESQFVSLNQEMTGKDVISAPEIIAARDGYDTLKSRLDSDSSKLVDNIKYTRNTFNYLSDGGRKAGPAVTFIADDAPKNDLTRLLPIMKEKGVPFGIAVVSEWIGKTINSSDFAGGSETFMDIDELRYMQENGAQILSHTANHKSMIDPSVDVESEMRSSYEKLSELGFVVDGFVYPYNYFNKDTISVAKKYYKYSFARGVSNLVGELDNNKINRYSLGAYYDAPSMSEKGYSTSSLEYYKERVDYAVANNEWLVFVLHTHTTNFMEEQQQRLRDTIDYIQSLGVDIVSPRDGFSRLGNIMQVGNLKIDSSGSLTGIHEVYYGAASASGISGQSPLTVFEKGKVSVYRVGKGDVTTGWGYPENYVYGILKTFYLDAAEPYFSYQTFESEEGSSYIRYWQKYAKVWGKWINNGAKVSVLNPTERDISGLSPITDFEKGKISVHKFGTTNVTDKLGFPVNFVFGILTTNYIDELVPQFAYQTFEVNGHTTSNVVYKRHWDNALKKWTAWSAGA